MMTVGPTLDGGLKLVPEEEQDWDVLLKIAGDAQGDLPQKLAGLMDEDSMWEDIVMPELATEFSSQRSYVSGVVEKARKAEEDEVIIRRDDAEQWYGALNQARLALEEKYGFGPRELRDADEISDEDMRSAYFRDEFYVTIQSLLMQYVLTD